MKEDFAVRGMGPNYFITTEGDRIVFVKEELCAWDCNIACWHAEEIKEMGHISGTGHINEVKSYAVSVALEGSGMEPYRDKQYTALISLMKRLIADYQAPAVPTLLSFEAASVASICGLCRRSTALVRQLLQ